ncbi:MAG TPA: hypothetical protein VFX23_12075 [Limnobacter sp.]|uniref:Uncharacterized protein n=1 Tax=Limnobacter litoralis TaxID=481366 RepID=A0ABQ5YNU9_9BURK|nr:hypothetical protein GCM10007875_08870 [Limnobacter litoralis]HEX5486720.1 hypothetical protein [Limnobacter sp.]
MQINPGDSVSSARSGSTDPASILQRFRQDLNALRMKPLRVVPNTPLKSQSDEMNFDVGIH